MVRSVRSMTAAMRQFGRAAIKAATVSPLVNLANRTELIESSQAAAMADDRFRAFVQDGDRLRDQGDWRGAEAAYASALSRYPYERSYWVQHGHMAKEQGLFARAEISYRTACALGAPAHDVIGHLGFVMACQNVDAARFPIRFYQPGPAARQVPARPDVLMLARLVWQVGGMDDADMLALLRTSGTCDELLAAMIGDTRFERANRTWLELVREDEL